MFSKAIIQGARRDTQCIGDTYRLRRGVVLRKQCTGIHSPLICPQYTPAMAPSLDEVSNQLERILASSLFSGSERSATFLRFCVEQSLAGDLDGIKESTLGVAVFGRAPDYDPKADAIVRVHARRVREKLETYYNTVGIRDDLLITIPKGRYIPSIGRREPAVSQTRAAVAPIAAAPRGASRWKLWISLCLATILCVAAVAAWRLHSVAGSPPRAAAEPVLFTWFPGIQASPAWSPDNQTLAYSWDEGHPGNPHIFLQKRNQAEPHRLTRGATAEQRPVWSPDGREVAFLRSLGGAQFEVVRHTLATGVDTGVGSFTYYWTLGSDPPSLDWSPDGRQFLISAQPAPDQPVRLESIDAVSGERTPMTQPAYGTSGDFEGRFSPDGSSIAFRRGGLGDLCIRPRLSGEDQTRHITATAMGIRGLAWSADSRSLFYGNHRDTGGFAIWRLTLAGATAQPLTGFGLDAAQPALSRDGKHLAFEQHERVVQLEEEPLAKGGQRSTLSPSERIDSAPAFSKDGRYLLFVSSRSGSDELWMQMADGSNPTQLTFLRGSGRPLNAGWAPDGSAIVVAIRASGVTNLHIFDLKSRRLRQITFGSDRLISPLYSKDGKSIFFVSNAGGENRIWRMNASGEGKPESIFGDAASFFQISEDGRFLYFLGHGPKLDVICRDLVTGGLRTIFKSDRQASSLPSFTLAGSSLYVAVSESPASGAAAILSIDVRNGSATEVLHVDRFAPGVPPSLAYSSLRHALIVPEVQRENVSIYILPLDRQ